MHEAKPFALRPVALLVVTAATALFFAADLESPVRVAFGLAFMLFVPGLAIAEVLGVSDTVHRLAIATGASIALETLVGLTLLYAGVFTVGRAFAIVIDVTALLLLAALYRAYRKRS